MYKVTVKVFDADEFTVYVDGNFKRAHAYFRVMDTEMPKDTILSLYLKDGHLLRRWWAGREANQSAS